VQGVRRGVVKGVNKEERGGGQTKEHVSGSGQTEK
jgi:hypothetical protein